MLSNTHKLKAGLACITAVVALALAPGGASANCDGGGITPAEVDICTPTPKARLLDNGMLIPPKAAPPRVKAVIAAANRIRTKPYIYGGGHGRWWDRGYDCSGSVSYALHGGEFLESPLPSGPMRTGAPAAKAVGSRSGPTPVTPTPKSPAIAGTPPAISAATGPRWHEELRDNVGFVARHPLGY